MTKPSTAQLGALRSVVLWSEGGSYMPSIARARTFDSCVRLGWLRVTSVDNGDRYNGYALTEAGEALAIHALHT